jgi:hypothetical protein
MSNQALAVLCLNAGNKLGFDTVADVAQLIASTAHDRKQVDEGRRIAEQLHEVRSTYKIADEVYREFRTIVMLTAKPDLSFIPPLEWIPISEH